ncbi:hypothetical protein [Sphingomonas sp. IW22]|uniref:hypothetical protein n=1 Tax=Sphingomonas sp. IW22 TaxID=3242489 RepID=UPI0035211E91
MRELGFDRLAMVHGVWFRRSNRRLIRIDNFGDFADLFINRHYYRNDPALLAINHRAVQGEAEIKAVNRRRCSRSHIGSKERHSFSAIDRMASNPAPSKPAFVTCCILETSHRAGGWRR